MTLMRMIALGAIPTLLAATGALSLHSTSFAQALRPGGDSASTPAARSFSYGPDRMQTLDFWRGEGDRAPLLLFIHGGGWSRGDKENATGSAKIRHYRAMGWAFASINYRLVPDVRVEDQAADVARAIAWVLAHKVELGIDGRGIVVMGHSAGAHLAALVGTDERYLKARKVDPAVLTGVILLDGAGYDVPAQMASAGPWLRRMYEQAFGTLPARQRALSPLTHVAAPNARSFLILHVDRPDSQAQSQRLGEALKRAGTPAEVRHVPDSNHMLLNRRLGTDGDPATEMVDSFAFRAFQNAHVVLPAKLKPIADEPPEGQ